MKMDSEDAATSAAKTGSKDASNSMFDPAKLLRTMRNRIKDIHVKSIGHGEVDSKPTLSLLNVSKNITVVHIFNTLACLCFFLIQEIESVVIRYTRSVNRRRKKDGVQVAQIEKD